MQQYFKILGTGAYLPERQVSAAEMDQRMNVPPGWTEHHTQVLNRFECRPPETIATMAGRAAMMALDNAKLDASAIDLIIDCSTSLYQPIPCNAAVYQNQLGQAANGIPSLDVHGTCLGFILGLNVANGLFAAGAYQRILLLISEAALAGVNYQEPESAGLMSDGAAAVVVESRQPTGSFAYCHQTFTEFLDACEVRSGCHRQGPFEYREAIEADFRFHMNGAKLYRIARSKLPPLVHSVFGNTDCPRKRIHIVPHQASPFAVESIRRLIDHPTDRYYNRCQQLGNMVAASIPVVLHQIIAENIVARGDTVMLLGTSAGYGQAGCTFRF